MKRKITLVVWLLLILTFALTLFACDGSLPSGGQGGSDKGSGNSQDVTNSEGGNTETGKTPEGGSGNQTVKATLVGAALSESGEITLKLSDGTSELLGTASYTDGGTISINYNATLMTKYGITGFDSLGDGEIALKIGEQTMKCVGAMVCSHAYDGWQTVSTSCTEKRFARSCPLCGHKEEKNEPYDGHVRVQHAAKAATCKETGYAAYETCQNCDYSTYTEIGKAPHTPSAVTGYQPTETEYGLSDGVSCSVCYAVIEAQQVLLPTGAISLDRYAGDYGYNYLGTMSNGDNLQSFYNAVDEVCGVFHSSVQTPADKELCSFVLGDYGVTAPEAVAVFKTYRADNPLYYWLSSSFEYNEQKVSFYVDEDYLSAPVRMDLNERIYEGVKSYLDKAKNATTAYETALVFHDEIIRNVNYAYQSDGVTPSSELYAHSILGLFVNGEGVCESYAESFQLLLNLRDIDNIMVSGNAGGEGHAWNLVKLDDGKYYWYDLTWDDTPDYMGGISYNYMAVDDDTPLGWRDYGWRPDDNLTFAQSHSFDFSPIGTTVESALGFEYALPDSAESAIPLSALRIKFTDGGFGYVRYNYDKVQITSITGSLVALPETVIHNGITYRVAAVGAIGEDLLMKTNPVSGDDLVRITISASVEYICDGALTARNLESIYVDEDNPYFSSQNGVLYTKNMLTLIKYPQAKAGNSFAVPDSVLYMAHGALLYLDSELTVNVGKNLRAFGLLSIGYCYVDSVLSTKEEETIKVNRIRDDRQYVTANIIIDGQNPNFWEPRQ